MFFLVVKLMVVGVYYGEVNDLLDVFRISCEQVLLHAVTVC